MFYGVLVHVAINMQFKFLHPCIIMLCKCHNNLLMLVLWITEAQWQVSKYECKAYLSVTEMVTMTGIVNEVSHSCVLEVHVTNFGALKL
jgi:hypothetical protein